MATIVHCPNCAKSYRVSDQVMGRRVKCQHCGEMFQARAVEAGAIDASAEAAPTAQEPASSAQQAGGFLEIEHVRGVTIVRVLPARINADNVEQIGDELLALAGDPANKRIVLNLARVEFLFSTALGKLVALEKKLQSQRGTLRLCELRPLVRESLESAGLTLILRIFATEQQAIAG
jgi:anti-anti-sigma factor